MRANPVEILLVEDNPADVSLLRRKMKTAKMLNNMNVVESGADAIKFLKQENAFKAAPRPDLILLDLNLPGVDGREVLSFVKNAVSTKCIPVVVLTSSEASKDVATCYELQANAYVRKPVDLAGYTSLVRAIDEFWLAQVLFKE